MQITNESDILNNIEAYQYSKAKLLLSIFLKTILQTLLSHTDKESINEITFQTNENNCITSIVFKLLSNKLQTNIHKTQHHEKILEYKTKYKDVLRYLSANLFKILDCKELYFDNEIELEEFVQMDNDVIDLIQKCNVYNKINYLKKIHFELEVIGNLNNIKPLEVLKVFNEIINETNSKSLFELNLEIKKLVTLFGGSEFNWNNINISNPQPIDVDVDKHDKYTMTLEPVKISKGVQVVDENIIDVKTLFADTVLNILGEEGFETLPLLSSNNILHITSSMLNDFVHKRLNKIFERNVSEMDIKNMFLKYNNLSKSFAELSKILQTLDEKDIIGKIKSMQYFISSCQRQFNIQNTYDLLDIIQKQNALVKRLNVNSLHIDTFEEYINSILRLNNNSTLIKFVNDFNKLYKTFLDSDFKVLFSIENLEVLLKQIKPLQEETKLLKIQLSKIIDANNSLRLELLPFQKLESDMGLDTSDMVDFLTNIYKIKPLNTDVKTFLKTCYMKLNSFDEIKKENNSLNIFKARTSSEMLNLEKELADYQKLKLDYMYCNEKLLDNKNVIDILTQERDQLIDEYEDLKNENEKFKSALIIGQSYINERNNEIEQLHERIQYLTAS